MKKLQISSILQLSATIALIIPTILLAAPAKALEIKDTNVELRNDFVLEPAKMEVFVKPGEKTTKTLSVVNRSESDQNFTIQIEDFEGSKDVKQPVVLLGPERGPYSLKDFIKPEVKNFKLKSKQRAIINVNIDIPADAEPGGKYASVLVSTASVESDSNVEDNRAKTISRIGALYFVRIAGPVTENGQLTDFRLTGPEKSFYEKGPFNFELLFQNNGNIHLTPGGRVEIKNMLGRKVKDIDVPPFFSLPDSLRSAQAVWDSPYSFGRYTATAYINRGYRDSEDVIDTITISFWVLPWKISLIILIAILLVAFVIRKVTKNFEIRKK